MKLQHLMRCICALLLLGASWTTAMAQGVKVHGVVLDESGESLIGVTVREKGTKNGTATDVDGAFNLNVASKKAILEFSYIGYNSHSQQVSPTGMKVVLKSSTEQLEDVVVVAYGKQKKVTVTGAVASVTTDDIVKSSSPNMSAALAGKLPGLVTLQSNGAPGKDNVTFYLRGLATVNGTDPLILVDGIPRESIREIDANEVASVTVLKDASATAVFGVRGANGVVLITTKRGEKGKVTVVPSVSYSMQSFARKSVRRDSWDYARLINEARANEGVSAKFNSDEIALFDTWRDGTGPTNASDRYWYPNTNWQDILFKDNASMVKANVDISGGSDRLQYFINAGYVYQGGMYNTESKKTLGYDPQAKMNRYNFRSNIDYTFSKYVKASIDLSSFIEKVNGTNGVQSALWADAITARSTSPGPLTVEGYQVQGTDGIVHTVRAGQVLHDQDQTCQSGYGNMNRSGYNLVINSGVNATGVLDINLDFLTPGLSAKGIASFQSRSANTTSALKGFVTYYFERNYSDEIGEPYYIFQGDDEEDDQISLSRGASSSYFYNLQFQLNYNRTFNKKHDMTAMFLAQRDFKEIAGGSSVALLPYNVLGVCGRVTYAYDGRYLGEFNAGYNGSEQFAPSNRFGFFPAFSAGWIMSNEAFMRDLRDRGIISNLKWRFSYGKVGNDQIAGGQRFLYLDNITEHIDKGHITSLANGGKISINYLGNHRVQWETAWKQNYGVDLTVFKDLSLSFDYFIEHRKDILVKRGTVPSISGLTSELAAQNMGEIDNKGYEIAANYNRQIGKDWRINLSGNFAFAKNKIVYVDEAQLTSDYAYRYRQTGYSVGQQFGYLIDHSVDPSTGRDGSGFFNSKDDIANCGLTYGIGTPLPGDFIYQDLNKDGVINEKDMAPIKNPTIPRVTYGFTIGGGWRGLDFSVMFQGVGKYSKYYSGRGVFEEEGSKYYSDINDNRWSAERYAAGEKITAPRLANSTSTSHVMNDYYIMDASYIRLKNVQVGYTLPKSICQKIKTSEIRFFVSGDNIYTWANLLTKSFDPEQGSILDYPLTKSYNCGVSLKF